MRLRTAALALFALGALTFAYTAQTRSTTRALAIYRAAAAPAPSSGVSPVALPASAFHDERGLPLTAIDEGPADAELAAGRYGWLLLGSEAMLEGAKAPVDVGDARSFDLARLGVALAVSAHAMAEGARSTDAGKRYAAALRLGASLRARGTLVDLLLGSDVLRRTLRAIARDRAKLDESALRGVAGFRVTPTEVLFNRVRIRRTRELVGWLDGPSGSDAFYMRGPIREEIALDALRDFDADMDVAAAAFERGATSCAGGPTARMLCARFERLRETDAAWDAFQRSLGI